MPGFWGRAIRPKRTRRRDQSPCVFHGTLARHCIVALDLCSAAFARRVEQEASNKHERKGARAKGAMTTALVARITWAFNDTIFLFTLYSNYPRVEAMSKREWSTPVNWVWVPYYVHFGTHDTFCYRLTFRSIDVLVTTPAINKGRGRGVAGY